VGDIQMVADDPAARRLNRVIAAPGPLTRALKAAGVRFVIADGGGGPASGSGPASSGAPGSGDTPGLADRLPGATVVAVAPGLVVYRLPGAPAGQ